MNLDSISIFIKVAQCGSFTRAARLLAIPVSTVSAKVSALEKKLGTTLLQRTTRKLQITEAGQIYFEGCVQALEKIQLTEAEISVNQKEPHGLLKITVPEDMGNNILPQIIHLFLSKYSHMHVEVFVTNQIIDFIDKGIDLAIRAGNIKDSSLKDSSLIAKKFTAEQLSLWASPSYLEERGTPSHPNQLNQHEFIGYSFFKNKIVKMSNNAEKVLISTPSRVLLNSPEMAKKLTLLGQGIGLLHDFRCEEEAEKGKIIKVLPQWHLQNLTYYFIYPSQRFISPKIRAFIAFAEEFIKKS